MRWLVGVLLAASACGLSTRHDDVARSGATGSGAAGSGAVGPDAAGREASNDGGDDSSASSNAGATAHAPDGSDGNQAGSAGLLGTGGTTFHGDVSDHHGTVATAAGGLGSSSSAGAGGGNGGAAAQSGGMTAAGGVTGSAGTTLAAGAGGCGAVIPSSHALHCEGTEAWGEIYFAPFSSDASSSWSKGETLELWFRTTAAVAPLISVWNQMAWDVLSLNVVDGGLCAEFVSGRTPPYNEVCTTTHTLNDGAWHHAALVAATSGLQFFEDGELVLEKPVAPPLVLPDQPNAVDLCQGLDGTQGTSLLLAGDLDEVRIWSGIRTPDEIKDYRATELCSAANSENGGVYLAAYYPLDESGDDMTIEDDSAVPHSGEFYQNGVAGSPWITPGAF
ncbi:MAG TPA: LamG-like jellyroll fold domain-containing protein [Polyangiaceae bacterium]|nr:LamG-like jellyroll fold domain-containing protein [Polyangiaceae bacterium]